MSKSISKIVFIFLFMFVCHNAYSQTIPPIDDSDNSQFLDNIDNLSNSWYVQQAINILGDKKYVLSNSSPDYIPDFSAEIYIERLSKLPAIIPLTYNDKVKAFIDVYNKRKRGTTEIMLGLCDYYFPMFEAVLDELNMPHELKYLAVIESALNPLAVSRVGATGLWQFMYATGRIYKLEVNSLVDDRRDPLKATYAAAKYLKDLYNIFGDWSLAIAAYNCGPGNVKKAIARSKDKTDFWGIYNHLPRETRGYVPAFIAATYIMSYYKEHNLCPRKVELPLYTDTIVLNRNLHLKQVADVLSIPLEQLRELNPQYKRDIIPAISKSYVLRLPYNYSIKFINLQDSIFAYKDSIYFASKIKDIDLVELSKTNPAALTANFTKVRYTVRKGDNIFKVAKKFDVGIDEIKEWNRIKKNYVYQGQKLIIYQDKPQNDTLVKKTVKNEVNKSEVNKPSNIVNNSKNNISPKPLAQKKPIFIKYKVVKGDTLWTIAQKFKGVTEKDLIAWNNLKSKHKLLPGQVLKIKKS